MACIEQQVTSQWCHELVMPAKTAAWHGTDIMRYHAITMRAWMVYRPLSGSGTRHQAGVRSPHLEGHPGIELRKVLALLCMARNQAPCGLQVVDSSLLMQGLAQPLERLYLCWPHSQQASAAKQAPLENLCGELHYKEV